MNKQISYFDKIRNTFEKEHTFFFIIIIVIIQLLDYFIFVRFNTKLFSAASILSAYCFINLNTSIYKLIMGSIVGTTVSYLIYKFFTDSFKKINTLLINLVTFISVLTCMSLLNCVFLPALAYSLSSYEIIPKSSFLYLSSLISSSIIIIILSSLLLNLIKNLNKNSPSINRHYQQLETNLSNEKMLTRIFT